MKKCLIVVDYQNDFVDGALGFEKATKIEDRIVNLIEKYQSNKDDIIYTKDTHEDDYLDTEEGQNLPVKHCIKGSAGHNLRPRIEALVRPQDQIIEKPTFPSLELGEILKAAAYDAIELVGLVSNICVLSNAVIAKAACPNARIIIDTAATASFDESLHEKALDVLEGLHIHLKNRG